MKTKNFILNSSSNTDKDTFIWNMLGSLLMAFQSVIMLMVLTRTVGLIEAGIFTIAYANANLFLTIGKYGMRNFQVSDVTNQFNFGEYLTSRKITSVMMMIVSMVYLFFVAIQNEYSLEKSMVILVMCILKITDAVEDVYHGLYQQRGRLDIAAKAMTLRIGATIVIFVVGLIVFKNQLIALIIATFFTTIILIVFTRWTYADFREEYIVKKRSVQTLLKCNFPLFAGAFLAFYIGNAPKYAIDNILSDEMQACYGFIAMPVFVIGLLNGFIFNPMLYRLSCLWNEKKVKAFVKKVSIQVGLIFAITGVCVLGAYLIGIPVLSVLYNTDLSPYKQELIVLLVGGGFLGLAGLLTAVITIIRFQKYILIGYGSGALLAYALSGFMVKAYGMMGAALLYMLLMGILSVVFVILLAVGMKIGVKKQKSQYLLD